MSNKKYIPIEITPHFYQLGIHPFPAYLSIGKEAMIIEGGTGATADIIVDQIEQLGIEPTRIKYVVLTHSHSDHIGAVPRWKKRWPHLKILAGPIADKLLQKDGAVKEFITSDNIISEIVLKKGEIAKMPAELSDYTFRIDIPVNEGYKIDLGDSVVWNVLDVPGHSPCHISLFNPSEAILAMGDATGFYVPEKGVFWPNYFSSLDDYCRSIKKLAALPVRLGALSHNGVISGDVKDYLRSALKATEDYYQEIRNRLDNGESTDEMAKEKAKWVYTLTDYFPIELMYDLAKVLISRSRAIEYNGDMFKIY
ncbi:MAG: MBL fold metallo-hydrolase [Dehalococcoidales bacterium]|nr:MBL fold metallo-hydrolase [Dehalococcoidales bacterium]